MTKEQVPLPHVNGVKWCQVLLVSLIGDVTFDLKTISRRVVYCNILVRLPQSNLEVISDLEV